MTNCAASWKFAGRAVSLENALLVGILNVTPDSFSDGGNFVSVEAALDHALSMFEQGAEIVDVGGESTRPGAQRVSPAEQIKRVVPVIEAIRGCHNGLVSIDTTNAEVAMAALDAGASVINDVSAGGDDPTMFDMAMNAGAGIVLMHRLNAPWDDQYSDQYQVQPKYDGVVTDVLNWLIRRIEIAVEHGIDARAIAIDPGLGFGKSVEQNMELVEGIGAFVETGHPVFVGASRKSFVGSVSGISDPASRDVASAEIALSMQKRGAQVFRVHDVRTHARMLQS